MTAVPGLPWPAIPEQYALQNLLRRNTWFKEFYESERPKIAGPLYWVRDSDLPKGIAARHSLMQNRVHVMRFRSMPVPKGSEFLVAHEIEHAMIDDEGFPSVDFPHWSYESVSAALNSSIHDLLVHSRLSAYGFDLLADYRREARQARRQLVQKGISSREPINPIERSHWTFNVLGKILDWHLASGSPDPREDPFLRWFADEYPAIMARAQRLRTLVEDVGYHTPEKMRTLLTEIISREGLSTVLSLSPTQTLPVDSGANREL